MVVQNQTNMVTGLGNGSARTFSFSPMVVNANSELIVTKVTAAGVESTLSEGATSTTYSVAITGSLPGTGSIDYPASGGTLLVTGESIIIKRVLTLEQQTDLENQGGYFPEVQETQFDKLVMMMLQQQEEIDRCFKLPISVDPGDFDPELPTTIEDTALLTVIVNAGKDGLALAGITDTPVDAFWVAVLDDTTLALSLASMGFSADVQSILLDANSAAITTELGAALLAANVFTGTQSWDKGADVGSTAGVMTLGTDGNYFEITGTNAITGITTIASGTVVTLHTVSTCSFVDSATFVMPTSANITAAAEDEFTFIETETAGTWRMVSYKLASGLAILGETTNLMTTEGDTLIGGTSGVPERLAVGSNDEVFMSNGTRQLWGTAPMSLSDWQGMSIDTGTDTAHDFDITAGKCRDAADTKNCVGPAYTKMMDANFAEGSAAGGMATGISLPTSATVHFFIAEKDATPGTFDYIGDTSVTMANGVTGWTMRRRIGSRRTDGSDNFLKAFQKGNKVTLDVPVRDITAANPGTSAVTAVLASIPAGLVLDALVNFSVSDANLASSTYGLITALTQTDTAPTSSLFMIKATGAAGEAAAGHATFEIETDTSNSLRYRISNSDAGVTVDLVTAGWIDSRGRGE